MELITNYNWAITIGLILLLIGIIIGGAYFVVCYGKRQARLANEYMKLYGKIQKVLTYEICEQNYSWLCRLFYRLDSCRYKNPEMRKVLLNEFREKYSEIIKRKNEVI